MVRYIDPDMTTTARVPDEEGSPTFTIGFFPPREAERLGMYIAKLGKIGDIDPVADLDKAIITSGLSHDVFRCVARYGIRGWDWPGGKAPVMEAEKIHGVEYSVLSPKSVDALYRSRLLFLAALECMKFNTLQEEEKKRSGSPSDSGSTSPDTNAADATTATQPKPT